MRPIAPSTVPCPSCGEPIDARASGEPVEPARRAHLLRCSPPPAAANEAPVLAGLPPTPWGLVKTYQGWAVYSQAAIDAVESSECPDDLPEASALVATGLVENVARLIILGSRHAAWAQAWK